MQRLGRQLGAFALLALLVRAFVPAGYMLAEADTPAGRYLVVQMCVEHSRPAQVIDLDTGKVVDQSNAPQKSDNQKKDAPCVFAGAGPVSAPPTTIEPVVFRETFAADFHTVRDLRPGRGIAAPPPPSTGPPNAI